jgi:hypothetical protein
MSDISAKFAFALLLVFASPAASFARHGGLAATRNIGSSGAGKCFQGSRATAAERNRAEFVHPEGVCRAPQTNIDGPETRCWTATSFPKFALESGLTPCSADNGTGAGISGDTALAPR